ncbi:MAG TPA: cytochrome b/b6 domain-containing protein [Acidimicrobiales bacterium]|nr:cytochrome b/b6 domain-containing protein [Acidimicrobiales bacterium]
MTTTMRLRFDGVTRAVHWATAALGLVALVSGTILYVPELSAAVGMRATLKDVHVFASLLLVVPLAVGAAAGPAGRQLRADLVELSGWSTTDWRWLRRRTRGVPAGKFNGGQKLVTAVFAGLFSMQLLTGLLMFRPNAFPDAWRTGATFVHDWAYIGLVVATAGHIMRAVSEPEMLQSMLGGTVSRTWAERERPTWTDR